MGDIIKKYLKKRGMKMKELSEITYINYINLSMKLNGKRKMSLDDLRLIVNALDISAEDIKKGLTA